MDLFFKYIIGWIPVFKKSIPRGAAYIKIKLSESYPATAEKIPEKVFLVLAERTYNNVLVEQGRRKRVSIKNYLYTLDGIVSQIEKILSNEDDEEDNEIRIILEFYGIKTK